MRAKARATATTLSSYYLDASHSRHYHRETFNLMNNLTSWTTQKLTIPRIIYLNELFLNRIINLNELFKRIIVTRIINLVKRIIIMNEKNDLFNVTLKCGISINFKGGLDKKYNYDGTFSYILMYTFSEYSDVRETAIREIENRAMECANKALSGYNQRAMMADEAVKLLMEKLLK